MGDTGASGPEHWDFGGELKIDLLVIVQASSPEALLALTSEYRSRMGEFDICIARAEEGVRLPNQKEHFGFLDGISDPHIEGAPTGRTVPKESVKAGEFILGYTNEYGILPPSPALNSGAKIDDIGKNGSFMVFRKLKQDVFAFREYFRLASENPEEEEFFIAKAVGRWKSGAPLVLSPVSSNSPASNDFGYASTDAHGLRCPIGAHIRRANPRDALNNSPEDSLAVVSRHRLLRRGALYGPRLAEEASANDGEDRGILFICIVADIRRQFEFVQQSWINNPKFGGLFNDPDPILGNPKDGDEANLTIQRRPVRKRLKNLPRFVTTKGGAYLFLPSISALKSLAALQSQDSGISPEESSLDGQK